LFGFLLWRLLGIAKIVKDKRAKIFIVGISAWIWFQVIESLAMSMGLAPVTGLPLPFLSYGGSSLIFNFIGLGIIESIKRYQTKEVLYKERSKKIL